MKITRKENKNSNVTIDGKDTSQSVANIESKKVVNTSISSTPEPEDNYQPPEKSSAQFHLLTLAKQHSLDGALIASEQAKPIEVRTQQRLKIKQLKQQQNLEVIIKYAMESCIGDKASDNADPDWFYNFTELAERVSNKTMQRLWGKILSREMNQPGSFSLKAIKVFKELSIKEAKVLARACSLAVNNPTGNNLRIVSGYYQKPNLLNFFSANKGHQINLNQCGLNYSDLMLLSSLDLIYLNEVETKPLEIGTAISLKLNESTLTLVPKTKNCLLKYYKFTPVGMELARLTNEKPNEEYLNALRQNFKDDFDIQV